MAYANYEFYKGTYRGSELINDDTCDMWLERASDAVNRATRGKIESNLATLTTYQMERIKYAVCLTADFFASIGDSSLSGTVTGYSIGDVSVQLSDNDKKTVSAYGIPQRAYDELIQTGFLYRGI